MFVLLGKIPNTLRRSGGFDSPRFTNCPSSTSFKFPYRVVLNSVSQSCSSLRTSAARKTRTSVRRWSWNCQRAPMKRSLLKGRSPVSEVTRGLSSPEYSRLTVTSFFPSTSVKVRSAPTIVEERQVSTSESGRRARAEAHVEGRLDALLRKISDVVSGDVEAESIVVGGQGCAPEHGEHVERERRLPEPPSIRRGESYSRHHIPELLRIIAVPLQISAVEGVGGAEHLARGAAFEQLANQERP